jgi:CRISPR-associated protein Cas5t
MTEQQRVLRVELEAPVCSFRYPHFLVGRQLTFDMPPPATIFGHVASALGEWPAPASFRFAYWFSTLGKGEDLENQHIVTPGSGRFTSAGQTHATALNATIQPVRREFLLGARLVLYLDRLELADAFLQPRFPVVLGRSQDLACYTRIEEVTLTQADRGYFEGTILPADFRKRTARGVTVLMPRYVGPPPRREAVFAPLIVLRDWVYCGPPEEGDRFGARQLLHLRHEPLALWIDPESPEKYGAHRVVWFHRFVDEQ